MHRSLCLLCCVLTFVAAGPGPAAVQTPERLFDFHSRFWVNLHHYLHALARGGAPLVEPLPGGATAGERERWTAAVGQYRERFGKRSLLFDEELVKVNAALAGATSGDSLDGVGIPAGHRALLESAAPVYRGHRWPAHDRANRRFIASLAPLLEQHGAAIASRLAATFDATWPAQPIPVDVVHDAGPPGNAYTISDPTHITIAAADPRHQGLAALEVVFHEASHRWDSVLMQGVSDAARRLDRPTPRNLWHALLFVNCGLITADALGAAGVRDFRMYADVQQMFDRAYRGWRPAILGHWPAFHAGRLSRSEAIERILRELPSPAGVRVLSPPAVRRRPPS